MQESPLSHLTRDLIFQRAELVGQLLHMDDALLDAKAPNDEWVNPRARRARALLGAELDVAGGVGDEGPSQLGRCWELRRSVLLTDALADFGVGEIAAQEVTGGVTVSVPSPGIRAGIE